MIYLDRRFEPGDIVMITLDAFGDSTETCDVRARGEIGVLTMPIDEEETAWVWRGNGVRTIPTLDEMILIFPVEWGIVLGSKECSQ